ncbi:hypothetical protein L1887_07349 [Cichorium endivia]|nr:hypothetical protein L1887_07349 [Cichorium endivia]
MMNEGRLCQRVCKITLQEIIQELIILTLYRQLLQLEEAHASRSIWRGGVSGELEVVRGLILFSVSSRIQRFQNRLSERRKDHDGKSRLEGRSGTKSENTRDVENISIPYYVSNFPLTADVKQIRKEFQKFGTVVDVFIAPRLSSAGKRFCFLRFIKGSQQKNKGVQEKEIKVTGDKDKNKVITLQGNEIKNEYSKHAFIFAKVRLVKSIPHLPMLLREEGFLDVNVKYVGSDWVYLMFDSEEVCSKIKKAKGIRSLFSILRPVLNGFHIKERIVWMEVSGLPCCAWNDVAVTKEECNQQEIRSMVEESEDDNLLLGSNDGNHSKGDQ